MTDQYAAPSYPEETFEKPSANGAAPSALREAAQEVKVQAGVLADQAAAKAKVVYEQSKELAGQRAAEARVAIVERPWAAVGVVFLAGILIGRAMGAGRPQVVYLKDRFSGPR